MESTTNPRLSKRYYLKGSNIRFTYPVRSEHIDQIQWYRGQDKIGGQNAPVLYLHNCKEEGHYNCRLNGSVTNAGPNHGIYLSELQPGTCGYCTPLQLIIEYKKNASDEDKEKLRKHFGIDEPRECPNEQIELWDWEPQHADDYLYAVAFFKKSRENDEKGCVLMEISRENDAGIILDDVFENGREAEGGIISYIANLFEEHKEYYELVRKIVKDFEDNYVQPISVVENPGSSGHSHIENPGSSGHSHIENPGSSGHSHIENSNFPASLLIRLGMTPIVGELPNEKKYKNLGNDEAGREILIAILDTGIYYHKDRDLSIDLLEFIGSKNDYRFNNSRKFGYNFVEDNDQPFDDHGHGTDIANIVLGGEEKNGKIKILPIKTHDENGLGLLFDCISGIYYAINKGANVINISWGHGAGEHSNFLEKAIKAANDKGIMVITSAGNDGENTDEHPHYPSSFSVDLDHVLAVGALEKDGESLLKYQDQDHSSGSGFGENTVQVYAEGEGYRRVCPTLLKGTSYATAKVAHAVGKFLLDEGKTRERSLDPPHKKEKFLNHNTEDIQVETAREHKKIRAKRLK